MRETPSSLRAYFIVIGVLGVLGGIQSLTLHPIEWRAIQSLIMIAISGAFLYVGWRLPRYLSTAPSTLIVLVWVNALAATLGWVLTFALEPIRQFQTILVVPVLLIVWLVAWYLLRSIKRLSLTACQAEAGATGPGTPPVGWYADPLGRHEQRYWDGRSWTCHVSSDEQVGVDELG